MIVANTTWKTKKNQVSRKDSKKESVSEVTIERKTSNNSDSDVSVFTRTTAPKVIVQSEKIDTPHIIQNIQRHRIIKSVCLIVIGIIILMTFFLSLKTYNNVNELYQLLSSVTN